MVVFVHYHGGGRVGVGGKVGLEGRTDTGNDEIRRTWRARRRHRGRGEVPARRDQAIKAV